MNDVDYEFTNLELRAMYAPARSELDGIVEVIDSFMHRDITKAQIEHQRMMRAVLCDGTQQKFYEQNQTWSEEEIAVAYEEWIRHSMEKVQSKTDQTTEAIRQLREYRVHQAADWALQQGASLDRNIDTDPPPRS